MGLALLVAYQAAFLLGAIGYSLELINVQFLIVAALGAWKVPNAFVEPTVFGAFNVFLLRFETAGYIGTLELTSYMTRAA